MSITICGYVTATVVRCRMTFCGYASPITYQCTVVRSTATTAHTSPHNIIPKPVLSLCRNYCYDQCLFASWRKKRRCTNSMYQEQRVQYVDPRGLAKGVDCHNVHGRVFRAVDSRGGFSRMFRFCFAETHRAHEETCT